MYSPLRVYCLVAGDALEDEDAAAEEGAGKADEVAQVCVVFFRVSQCRLSECLSVLRVCLSFCTHTLVCIARGGFA